MQYYAQRKSIKDGNPQAINNRFGTRPEMERQYHLYCASAATNADGFEVDSIEWGTVEQGVIERKVWINDTPEETPEEPTVDEPTEGE